MSARGFWRDAGWGLLASVAGAVAFHALAPMLGSGAAVRSVIALLAAAAALAVLLDREARVGRVVAFAAWALLLGTLVVFDAPLWFWIGLPAFALWLTRSLFRYHALWQAAADGLLSLFALAAAFVALRHTHSVFLALWCWCLVQALAALIPRDPPAGATPAPTGDRYDQAQRSAEAALRRLATPR